MEIASASPQVQVSTDEGSVLVTLQGALTVYNVTALEKAFSDISTDAPVCLDLARVSHLDTAAAWAIVSLRERLDAAGRRLEITGAGSGAQSLLESVAKAMPKPDKTGPAPKSLTDFVVSVGEGVVDGVKFLAALVSYFGLFLARLACSVIHPKEFRLTALVSHCQEVGLKAVPIVALMAFLIGVVLAFQGSTQLQQFGAEVFVVDLISISILRELGILLTAIIVAGRTASAFAAAIGSMKMREEIDAMLSLGLDPATVLLVPRILALVIMLPILGGIANVMGLIGGGLMAWIDLGISPAMFVTRLLNGTDVNHLLVGMVKAPVFAVIIGVVGCHAGMQVKSNAESLGQKTSSSVVTAIFAVIVADALFSIFFAEIGV